MSTLIPFDDVVVLLPVRPAPISQGGIVVPDKLDESKRFGKVVSVGPGKVIPMGGRQAPMPMELRLKGNLSPDEIAAIEAPPEGISLGTVVPNEAWPPRYPMNAQPGDYVIFSAGMKIMPDGPGTVEFIATRNECILAKIEGFIEHDETVSDRDLMVPVPSQLVDATGMPFRKPGTGRA